MNIESKTIVMRELLDAAAIAALRGDGLEAARIMAMTTDPRASRRKIEIRSWLDRPERFRFVNANRIIQEAV